MVEVDEEEFEIEEDKKKPKKKSKKKLIIIATIFIVIVMGVILIMSSFSSLSSLLSPLSHSSIVMAQGEIGSVSSSASAIDTKDVLSINGITGIHIKEVSINGIVINKTDISTTDFNLTTNFKRSGLKFRSSNDGVKQEIYLTNNKNVRQDINSVVSGSIDYNSITWNGTTYDLRLFGADKPLILRGFNETDIQTGKRTDKIIAPNIFMGTENKRINFQEEANTGGYMVLWNDKGISYWNLTMPTKQLDVGQIAKIDPTYYNQTDGFSTSSYSTTIRGLFTNGSDFWIISNPSTIYHTNRTGSNLNSISISAIGASNTFGITTNGSDFWITDYTDKFIYHVNSTGGNITDGFPISNFVPSGSPQGIVINVSTGSPTDFWILDYAKYSISHANSTGGNMTDGVNFLSYYANTRGLFRNGSDFWINSESLTFIYHLNSTGSHIDNISVGSFGISVQEGLTSNVSTGTPTDFWVSDLVDSFIYHISVNEVPSNPNLNIVYPLNNYNFSNTDLDINYTYSNGSSLQTMDSCWYSNDSYKINTSLGTTGNCLNITTVTWVEGKHNLTIWVNDSLNYEAKKVINFTIDTVNPNIIIRFPNNDTNWSTNTLNVNYTASDLNIFKCWYSNDTYLKNTSLTNCLTNITTQIWSEGQHNVSVYVNDSAGNVNKSDVTFRIDQTNPSLKLDVPANNTNYAYSNVNINYTAYDINGISLCWYSNDTMTKNTTMVNCNNVTVIWADGQHNLTIYINDTTGNKNQTSINFTITTISDTEYPQFSLYQDNNATQTRIGNITLNVTVTSTNGTVYANFNNTLYKMTNSTSNDVYNLTILNYANGTFMYNYTSWGNGTSANKNSSLNFYYTINDSIDTTPPYFVSIPAGEQVEYGNIWAGVTFIANDDIDFESYAINDTIHFVINGAGELDWTGPLSGGNYYVNVTINDTSNNLNSTIYNLNITKSNGLIRTYVNNTESNFDWTNGSNIWLNATLITGTGNINLTLNGTLINYGASPLSNLTNLSVGYYNLTGFYDGNENYSADVEYWWINISLPFVDTIPPYFTVIPSNLTTPYLTSIGVDFEATDAISFGTYSVNDTRFTINSTGWLKNATTIGAGNYEVNITINDSVGNINSTLWKVNITKMGTSVKTYLGDLRSNLTITNNTNVWLNATLTNMTGVLRIFINETAINTGNSPLSNLSGFNITGIYNITGQFNGDANHEASYETWWLNVTGQVDIIPPVVIITIPFMNNTNTNNATQEIDYTATDNVALDTCWYSNDSYSVNVTLENCTTNITTITWTQGWHSIKVYANDTSSLINWDATSFFVDSIAPVFTLSNKTLAEGRSFSYHITSTDAGVGGGYWDLVSITEFNISILGTITNISGLGADGDYYLINVSKNDSLGNTHSGVFNLSITPYVAPPSGGTGGNVIFCRYDKFGYFNKDLPVILQQNCISNYR